MQINRLLEIVYILLQQKLITAKELAARFGVSQRTIYRDIDTLSLSGIPIYTEKGKGGGISLLSEFVLSKTIPRYLSRNVCEKLSKTKHLTFQRNIYNMTYCCQRQRIIMQENVGGFKHE